MSKLRTEPKYSKWWKWLLRTLGFVVCIILLFGIIFSLSVFKEIDKYHIVITPGSPSSVSVESTSSQTTRNDRKIDNSITLSSGIKGTITIGPTCPVEKDHPDPDCADKPFSAVIDVLSNPRAGEGKIVKTFSSKANGTFMVGLEPGTYTLSHSYKAVMPTFYPVEVTVTSGKYTEINLQFDSGIR